LAWGKGWGQVIQDVKVVLLIIMGVYMGLIANLINGFILKIGKKS
jgi:hypothetical protein